LRFWPFGKPYYRYKGNFPAPTGSNTSSGNLLYFYHSDHLGSSSLVTDMSGNVTQHVEYVPFGEVFIEERDNETWSTPYKFNGKELDEETGLYYYGARYYDPRVSLWLGVDPLAEKYPGCGGICVLRGESREVCGSGWESYYSSTWNMVK